MSSEVYVVIGAILGGLIGFASSFFTTLLTQRHVTQRRKEERDWHLEDQSETKYSTADTMRWKR